MKNTKILWAIIALLLLLVAGMAFKIISGKVEPAEDGRTAVLLDEDERELILEEMREFLVSTQAVSQAITANDMEAVGTIASKAGMAAEEGTPGSIFIKIPVAMKKLGFDTRAKFDEIAVSASTGDAAKARTQLDQLMLNCIACHAAYKLPEAKPQ